MPKNQVSDPITDQEVAFAHLVLSGTMTDRRAAEAVGLNPDTAAYTKAKPRVRAYMLEHRAGVHEQLVQQETEGLRRLNQGREQVLARLWEIANLDPEMTRNSASAQIKALSMIVAIEGLISDRRAGSSEKKSASPPAVPQIDIAAWLREQQGKTTGPQSGPDPVRDEDGPGVPDPPPGEAADVPAYPGPDFDSSEFIFPRSFSPAERAPLAPHVPVSTSAPGNRVPSSIYRKDPLNLAPETLKETHCAANVPKRPKRIEFYRTLQNRRPTEP
jgi:hypothetical protein